MKRLAMDRSDVDFSLEHDGRASLAPADDAPARGRGAMSHELDRHGVGIDCNRDGLGLTGVVSCRPSTAARRPEFLFVQFAPVKDRLLVGAVGAAHTATHRPRRHRSRPCPPSPLEDVDVNVTRPRPRSVPRPSAVRG